MKILIVGTFYKSGGAAIAAHRLVSALSSDCDVSYLTQKSSTDSLPKTYSYDSERFGKMKHLFRFITERLYFLSKEKNKKIRYNFSPANTGVDITKHPLFQSADVIHLHWINQGFISIDNLEQIIKSNKPIVVTLHDMWYFTGGCHYSGTCEGYKHECGNCPFLSAPNAHDVSYQLLQQKISILSQAKNVRWVTCSNWLQKEALSSTILKHAAVASIPNPLPEYYTTELTDTSALRTFFNLPQATPLILIGAMQLQDERKGFAYFKKALDQLKQESFSIQPEIVIFGGLKKKQLEVFDDFPFTVHYKGQMNPSTELPKLYAACDVFVLPSLEDNLPNTVAEAMSQATPVVAFNIGGLSQMIDSGVNGYLAEEKDSSDLAKGIYTVLTGDLLSYKKEARRKAIGLYDAKKVSSQYISVYTDLLNSLR